MYMGVRAANDKSPRAAIRWRKGRHRQRCPSAKLQVAAARGGRGGCCVVRVTARRRMHTRRMCGRDRRSSARRVSCIRRRMKIPRRECVWRVRRCATGPRREGSAQSASNAACKQVRQRISPVCRTRNNTPCRGRPVREREQWIFCTAPRSPTLPPHGARLSVTVPPRSALM